MADTVLKHEAFTTEYKDRLGHLFDVFVTNLELVPTEEFPNKEFCVAAFKEGVRILDEAFDLAITMYQDSQK